MTATSPTAQAFSFYERRSAVRWENSAWPFSFGAWVCFSFFFTAAWRWHGLSRRFCVRACGKVMEAPPLDFSCIYPVSNGIPSRHSFSAIDGRWKARCEDVGVLGPRGRTDRQTTLLLNWGFCGEVRHG